jgi:hypothetical protein
VAGAVKGRKGALLEEGEAPDKWGPPVSRRERGKGLVGWRRCCGPRKRREGRRGRKGWAAGRKGRGGPV